MGRGPFTFGSLGTWALYIGYWGAEGLIYPLRALFLVYALVFCDRRTGSVHAVTQEESSALHAAASENAEACLPSGMYYTVAAALKVLHHLTTDN